MSVSALRSALPNLTLLLAALVLSLLLAEVTVRVVGAAPVVAPIAKGRFQLSPNPKIGYEPIPNVGYDGKSLEFFQYRGTSNRRGYRGPAYSDAKPPGIYRIAVFGDSVTEGIGIDDYEDLYTAKLERKLREAGVDAQVMNFGVSGYNTQQEVETLKDKAVRLDPDLVLLAYSLNDTAGPGYWILRSLLLDLNDKERVHSFDEDLIRHLTKSALYRFVRFRLLAPDADDEKYREYKKYMTDNSVEEYVGELARVSESSDFKAVVVVFPQFTDRTFTAYRHNEDHAYIRSIAEAQDQRVFDLLPAFTTCRKEVEGSLHRDNLHPNKRGHTRAADAIAKFVLEMLGPEA